MATKKKRTIYDVKPQGDGPGVNTKWALKKRGNQRATGVFDNKAEAIKEGQGHCKRRQPSQLVIHNADGKFEKEYTYGNDPHPPKG